MCTHFKIVGAVVGGVLASCLAFQTPGHSQDDSMSPDCKIRLQDFIAAENLSRKLGTLEGYTEFISKLESIDDEHDKAHKRTMKEIAQRRAALDPKSKTYYMDQGMLSSLTTALFDTENDKRDAQYNAARRKYLDANPDLQTMWQAYVNCLPYQERWELGEREAVVPPKKTKPPEPPVTNAEDVIWEILMRVRTAPDPDKELKLTDEEAVAWVVEMLELTDPGPKPRKTRKATRTTTGSGDGGQEATQKHDPDATAVTIMLLGTAAGAAADSLRHRGSGGGGGGVKPGSGGCSGGACPRPR